MSKHDGTSQLICGVFDQQLVVDFERRGWPYYMEDPNQPLDDTALVAGGMSTRTGEPMTYTRALEVDPVWQSVSMISGDLAARRLEYRERIDGTTASRVLRDEPLNRLLAVQPNEELNAFEFWRRYWVHLLIWGNAYIWIIRDPATFEPVELVNLLPDRTQAYRVPVPEMGEMATTLVYRSEVNAPESQLITLSHTDVIHHEWIHDVTRWGLEGHDVTRRARNSWALALAQTDFASRFFKHGGRVGGILMLPEAMSKPSRDNAEKGFRRAYDEPFKTVVIRDGAKFAEAQHSFSDTQLVEGKEQTARDVARRFNLPPSKLGLADSTSYNSKSEDNRAYLDQTLRPFMRGNTSELDAKLIPRAEQGDRFTRHDVSDLLQLDPVAQSQVHSTQIAARVINPNEARADLELEPYDGGDDFINPNVTPTDDQADDDDAGTDGSEDTEAEERQLRLRRAVYECTNVARRRARKDFPAWQGYLLHGMAHTRPLIRSLVGNEAGDELVDQVLEICRAASTSPDDLYDRLDLALTAFESKF